MNDFLQSLRGGQKDKRAQKTRRGFDNSNQYNSNQGFNSHVPYHGTRGGNMKRNATRASAQNHTSMDAQSSFSPSELSESINSLVDIISKSQKAFLNVQEKRVIAEERKAIALEEIAEYLRVISMPPIRDDSDEYVDQRFDDNSINDEDSDIDSGSPEYQTSHSDLKLKSYREDESEEIELTLELDVDDDYELTQSASVSSPAKGKSRRVTKPQRERGRRSKKDDLKETEFDRPIENPKKSKTYSSDKRAAKQYKNAPSEPGKEEVKIIKRKKVEKPRAEKRIEHTEEILSRDEVMKIVYDMRAQGATFDQVAQHLVDLGQPTFSGRGEWHAQTVHRLCNKRTKH